MSEVIACDGCGKTTHPDEVRRICDHPWITVDDTIGGAFNTKHACSPDCLVRIGRDMGGDLPTADESLPGEVAGA